MRQPTPAAEAYDWHTRTLAGERVAVDEGDPQPGWYRFRETRGGPWIPIVIWIHAVTDEWGELTEPEQLLAQKAGQPVNPLHVWGRCRPVSQEAFAGLLATIASEARMAATQVAFDLGAAPVGPLRRR